MHRIKHLSIVNKMMKNTRPSIRIRLFVYVESNHCLRRKNVLFEQLRWNLSPYYLSLKDH